MIKSLPAQGIWFVLYMLLLTSSTLATASEDCNVASNSDQCKPKTFGIGYDDSPSNYTPPGEGMTDRNTGKTFSLAELMGTSMNGILDEKCGGYCITGFCVDVYFHIGTPFRSYFYTIISPRLQHAMPDLLISAYNTVGSEPLSEWQSTFGKALSATNRVAGALLASPELLAGTKSKDLPYSGQSVKDVDIIGHPMTMLPDLINDDSSGKLKYKMLSFGANSEPSNSSSSESEPTSSSTSESESEPSSSSTSESESEPSSSSTSESEESNESRADKIKGKIKASVAAFKAKLKLMLDIKQQVRQKIETAINALKAVQVAKDIKQTAQTIKNMKKTITTMLDAAEATLKGSVLPGLVKPRFKMPRFFCPTEINPLQPYYLSFADAFWWRAGYPLTDGPISKTDYSSTIFNPLSTDTLPATSKTRDRLKTELWGHLYPRTGSVSQGNDAKGASVIAWRALDVLKTAVKDGSRVGLPLPKIGKNPKWQMIYPEVKQCQDTPYYSDNRLQSVKLGKIGDKEIEVKIPQDSLMTSSGGAYAWNHYSTYTCCSSKVEGTTRNRPIGSTNRFQNILKPKLCLPLGDILAGIKTDKENYDEWKKQQEENEKNPGGK